MVDPIEKDELDLEPEYAEEFTDLFGEEPKPAKANPRFIFNPPDTLSDLLPQDNLTEDLGEVADGMRELLTDFGQRPYRVFSVIYSWSGGEEGRGELDIVSEREFLPRPLVDIRQTRNEMTAAGQRSKGSAKLIEVSPRMTEDEIRHFAPTAPLPKGQFSFIEIRMDARDGTQVVRRRYTVKDTPYRNAEKFWWEVPLTAQQQRRTRQGELSTPQLYPSRLRPDEASVT